MFFNGVRECFAFPNFGQYKPEREGFVYNKEEDSYQCVKEGGNGAVLPFRKETTDSKGYTKKVYRSNNKKCKNCPLRSTCIGKSDFKKLDDSIHKPLYDKMHQKLIQNQSYAKRMVKVRSKTVEPVLGTLINFLNMKKINSRGIKQANKHVLMAALTYNLKKYLKFIVKKTNEQSGVVCPIKGKVQLCLKTTFFGVKQLLLRHFDFEKNIVFLKINLA